jgi:hypothetical protein
VDGVAASLSLPGIESRESWTTDEGAEVVRWKASDLAVTYSYLWMPGLEIRREGCTRLIGGFPANLYEEPSKDGGKTITALWPNLRAPGFFLWVRVSGPREPSLPARALGVFHSVKFINDPSRIRVVSVGEDEAGKYCEVLREDGVQKRLRVGDQITWDRAEIVSISKDRVATRVTRYDSNADRFFEETKDVAVGP